MDGKFGVGWLVVKGWGLRKGEGSLREVLDGFDGMVWGCCGGDQ